MFHYIIILWNLTDCTNQGSAQETETIESILSTKGFIMQIYVLRKSLKGPKEQILGWDSRNDSYNTTELTHQGELPSEGTTWNDWLQDHNTMDTFQGSGIRYGSCCHSNCISTPRKLYRRNTESAAVKNKPTHSNDLTLQQKN